MCDNILCDTTHTTHTTTTRFKKCGACLHVQYCGSSCQKIAWPNHKKACRAAQSSAKILNAAHPIHSPYSEKPDVQELSYHLVQDYTHAKWKNAVAAAARNTGTDILILVRKTRNNEKYFIKHGFITQATMIFPATVILYGHRAIFQAGPLGDKPFSHSSMISLCKNNVQSCHLCKKIIDTTLTAAATQQCAKCCVNICQDCQFLTLSTIDHYDKTCSWGGETACPQCDTPMGRLTITNFKAFTRLEKSDDHISQYALGSALLKGKFINDGIRWLKRAAKRGNVKAQYTLGGLFLKSQDYAHAEKWLTKAADQGDSDAQNNLGSIYANGDGVQTDLARAKNLFQKSADQGNMDAKINLSILSHL